MTRVADAGYSDSYKRGSRHLGIDWRVNDKRKPKQQMSTSQRKRNRQNSKVRARIEHCFRVIKCQFGYILFSNNTHSPQQESWAKRRMLSMSYSASSTPGSDKLYHCCKK